jgi:hypothetical protein
MTNLLFLRARPDASIACDMSTARDTPDQRFAEYAELFERALLGRERRADGVVLSFRGEAQQQVEDLARREHACCPFLDYRVEVVGGDVVWTITDPIDGPDRAAADAVLDAFHELPAHVEPGMVGYPGAGSSSSGDSGAGRSRA